MVDSNTIFYLILVALILFNTCLFIIVYILITSEKEKKKSIKAKDKTAQKCLHYFGYLGKEHPRNQPVPDGCFRCHLALDCLNKSTQKRTAETIEVKA